MCFSPGAHVAQSVERILGKDEVISSILIVGSNFAKAGEGPNSIGGIYGKGNVC